MDGRGRQGAADTRVSPAILRIVGPLHQWPLSRGGLHGRGGIDGREAGSPRSLPYPVWRPVKSLQIEPDLPLAINPALQDGIYTLLHRLQAAPVDLFALAPGYPLGL